MGKPIYQGSNSCYAQYEGIYVKRISEPGIDTLTEAAGILALILRDYRRGWTYDDVSSKKCRKIPMDPELFARRTNYVLTLAHRHRAPPSVIRRIEDLVQYVIKYKRLPREYMQKAKKAITKVTKKKRRTRGRKRKKK